MGPLSHIGRGAECRVGELVIDPAIYTLIMKQIIIFREWKGRKGRKHAGCELKGQPFIREILRPDKGRN